MGHFKEAQGDFWEGFQAHMGYTDEELEFFKQKPKLPKIVPKMLNPKLRNSTLIIEVIKSHGCSEGMKAGDKLYFTGCSLLDTKRSSNWCAYAMFMAGQYAALCQNMIIQGLDPNDKYEENFGCMDCGLEYGWGMIVMTAYVIDESDRNKARETGE